MSQILENIPLASLAEDHLKSLVLLRVREGVQLDYKSELTLGGGRANRELCKDVSALANTTGGYILFGVAEDDGGHAQDIPGIEIDAGTEERVSQILTNGIGPHLQKFTLHFVPLECGQQVLVIHVEPDTFLHQVKYEDNRFYKRVGSTTTVMDPADVAAFYAPSATTARVDEVQDERDRFESRVRTGQFHHLPIQNTGMVALSVIPFRPVAKLPIFDDGHTILFPPLYCSGWDRRYLQQAIITFGTFPNEECPYSVTEVTESGSAYTANSFLLSANRSSCDPLGADARYVPSIAYEREIIASIHKYLNSLIDLGVGGSFVVGVSLLNIRGYTMSVDSNYSMRRLGRILSQNEVITRPVEFSTQESFDSRQSVAKTLQPAFDEVWRAFNFPRSLNFTKAGDWVAR